MKRVIFFSMVMTAIVCSFAGSAQTSKSTAKVEAYYFHNAIRCTTCKTVEAEAKIDLKELYGNQVIFQALNLEEDAAQAIAKKLEVSGQTLLVVKGDKKINLTNEGFLYAVTNPEKFKSIIKEKVDPLMDL